MVVFRFGFLFCLLALSLAKDKRVFLTSFTNPLTGGSSGGLTGGSGGLTGGLTGGSSGLMGGLTGGSGGLTGGLSGLTGGLTGGLPGLSTGGFFLGGTTNLLSSVTNYWKNLFGALFNVPATSQTNSLFNSLPGLNGGSGLGGLTGGGGSSGSLPSGGSSLGQYNVDKTKISVSGLSAGGAMATQFHVIYSSEIMGAGIIAGLPFYCTRGKGVMEALGNCMKTPGNIDVAGIVAATKQGASGGQIDATSNMQNDKVYIFDGRADTTVNPVALEKDSSPVGPKIQEFYQQFASQGNIKTVFSYNAQHGQPVDNPREGACAMQNSRWINNCGYSAAYDLLNHIYGNLKKPAQGAAQTGELLAFSQTEFISNAASNGMDEVGYIYIPQACKNAQQACKLHIAFHGCKQGRKIVGDAYVRHAGYNEVADLNNIIILYPQAQASTMNGNINGCFDWWGYAGKTFATKDGIQEKAVKGMLDRVTG